MFSRITLLVLFFFSTRMVYSSPLARSFKALQEENSKLAKQAYQEKGIILNDACFTCGNLSSLCEIETRPCYLCHCNFCDKHSNNFLTKISKQGGVICDQCFAEIAEGNYAEVEAREENLEERLGSYAQFFATSKALSDQLKADAEFVTSKKFKQNLTDAVGDSIGMISSLLLISGRIALIAVPGCQAISIISLCSLVSGVSSVAIKEGGAFLIDCLNEVESLSHLNLIATIFFINQTMNTHLGDAANSKGSQFHSAKPRASEVISNILFLEEVDSMNEILTNPLLKTVSLDSAEENSSCEACQNVVLEVFSRVFGVVGLAKHSFGLFNNTKELIEGSVSDLSQSFLKIAKQIDKLPCPESIYCYPENS